MAERTGETGPTWDKMGLEQLKLYAQELAQLYRKEQRLRQEVEAKSRELEQRVRELTALNAMFQRHADRHLRTEEAYKLLLAGLRTMVQQTAELLRRAEQLTPPEGGEKTDE